MSVFNEILEKRKGFVCMNQRASIIFCTELTLRQLVDKFGDECKRGEDEKDVTWESLIGGRIVGMWILHDDCVNKFKIYGLENLFAASKPTIKTLSDFTGGVLK